MAVAIPTFAFGDAAPPLTGSIKAVDFGFQNLADTSSDSVTIAAGGTVTFSYSSGSSFHNVASDGPAPASPAASVSVPSEVSGNVNPTLSISLSSSASLGSFTAGLAQDYETTVPATVSSSAGDATLSVADGSATASGHLVNGSFALAQPVQARATNAAHPSSAFAPVTSTPVTLLTYGGPASNDQVTIGIRQSIGASEPLRTGTYSKTLTFTLSTTTP